MEGLLVAAAVVVLIVALAVLVSLAHWSAAQTRRRGYRSRSSPTLRWLTRLIEGRDRGPRRRGS